MWGLHGLFHEMAAYMGADFEGSEYEEFNVKPNSIHKKKRDHKQAVYLASKLIGDEIEDVEPIESWDEDYEPEYPFESGDLRVKKNTSRTYIEYNEVDIHIYRSRDENKRLDVLKELTEVKKLSEALEEHYSHPNIVAKKSPYHQLSREILDDGKLPENDIEDVKNIVDWFRE